MFGFVYFLIPADVITFLCCHVRRSVLCDGLDKGVKFMEMLKAVLLFALGAVLLIKGGDWFVDGATGIARKFHVPELIIGATVVSIGTTIPEVMVSAQSALIGHGEIAYGNAIGSVICNTSLIAAITLIATTCYVDRKTISIPVYFFFAACAFYCFAAYILGRFNRLVGIVLLAMFVAYVVINVKNVLRDNKAAAAQPAEEEDEEETTFGHDVLLLVLGAVLIAFGANLLVENGTLIAQGLGVPESVIALTFVALGTSLPELVTAITSLRKGHGNLGLGNVIGANLFNLVLVTGVSAALNPFDVPRTNLFAGHPTSLVIEIPVMILVMLLLCIPAMKNEKVDRKQGIPLIIIYAAFCFFQFFM